MRHRWMYSDKDGVPLDPQPEEKLMSDFVWATCLGCGVTILTLERLIPDRCHVEYRIGRGMMPEDCESTVVQIVMES